MVQAINNAHNSRFSEPFLAMKAIFLVFINPKEMFSKAFFFNKLFDIFSTDNKLLKTSVFVMMKISLRKIDQLLILQS
jgi:hypothetical protein